MGSVWESLERFWGNEFVLCVGHFRVGLWDRVCAVCGTVWCRFVGGSLRCVWYSLVCFEGESLCCVWDTLLWVFGRVCVLCVGQFGVGLWERVCVVSWTVWCGFVGESVCCVWGSLVWV